MDDLEAPTVNTKHLLTCFLIRYMSRDEVFHVLHANSVSIQAESMATALPSEPAAAFRCWNQFRLRLKTPIALSHAACCCTPNSLQQLYQHKMWTRNSRALPIHICGKSSRGCDHVFAYPEMSTNSPLVVSVGFLDCSADVILLFGNSRTKTFRVTGGNDHITE